MLYWGVFFGVAVLCVAVASLWSPAFTLTEEQWKQPVKVGGATREPFGGGYDTYRGLVKQRDWLARVLGVVFIAFLFALLLYLGLTHNRGY